MAGTSSTQAILALLAGATVWGLIWYPYRILENAGVAPVLAATLTYLVAFLLGAILLRRSLARLRFSWQLLLLALAAGGCNLGYVVGTVDGEVMRVLLLFYLAPLWTVLIARPLLGERLSAIGAAVILLSLAGAMVMLWEPSRGWPLPANTAEWMGLSAGFLFALSNVLVRRMSELSIEIKSLAVCAGVAIIGLGVLPFQAQTVAFPSQAWLWPLLLCVGAVLLAINLIVQFGLTHTAANQAIVIFLFELVVAAISSWFLAGEVMTLKEWSGGAMIIAASLFSGRIEAGRVAHRVG